MDDPNPLYSISCLRCGICCTKHQAIVSLEETKRIASYLGITIDSWELAYSDPKWRSATNYLIRHVNGACVFLEKDKSISYCGIQPCKPSCCTDWLPNFHKKECREGLSKYRELAKGRQ